MHCVRILICAALLACNREADPKTESSAPVVKSDLEPQLPAAEQTQRIAIKPHDAPTVTVIDAGADPRERLYLRPTVGTSEKITLMFSSTMASGARNLPMVLPPVVVTSRQAVLQANDNEIQIRQELESIEVREAPEVSTKITELMRAQLESAKSFRSDLVMTTHGSVKSGSIEMPKLAEGPLMQMLQQTTENFSQIQVPLPPAAVGVGATWRAEVTVAQMGFDLLQTATYTLVARQGDVLSIDTQLEQRVEPIVDESTPFKDLKSSGKGHIELDLAHVTPIKGTLQVEVDMALAGQQEQHLAMKLSLEIATASY